MELEKAIDRLIMMKHFICFDSDEDEENQEAIRDIEAIETVLNYIENSIPKQKVEEKYKEEKAEYNKIHAQHYRDCGILENRAEAKIEVLQELLEGK